MEKSITSTNDVQLYFILLYPEMKRVAYGKSGIYMDFY